MDFVPHYAQPFTLAEAVKLDIFIITEEITRLQNSLQHLKRTQTSLQEHIDTKAPEDVEPELEIAFEENKIVIGSQEERIVILKLAMREKGVYSNSHYSLDSITTPARAQPTLAQASQEEPVENGIHL